MSSFHFPADEIPGIGTDHETGRVTIVAHRDDGDELELSFPSEEIPQLGQLLASAFAALSTATRASAPQVPLLIENAEILAEPPNLILLATLSSGLPVAYSLPLGIAATLRDQLNENLT